ncbi:MAG: hypothetical protein EU541_06935 [Promethearchaeota archaeon]|nr:MAG: hypothetical protein EU541_06935 [Candidatus Lokiarchaeota archaeon]
MIPSILLTIGLNILPLVLFAVPLIFSTIRETAIGKLYMRIVFAISIFYLIYWIIPIIFQFSLEPNRLEVFSGEEGLGISYILVHFTNLIDIFSSYPLIALPFIFLFAPFISLIIVWNKLRQTEGSIKENLKDITYEYNESPFQRIKSELLKTDWDREKEILRLMIVLLPVSLYILQVILKVSGLQNFSLNTAETALGWFLEILFVYLAVFLFSIELIRSSKLAIKGRYFGEKVRSDFFRSLYMVGVPISIISIFLFILEYLDSIDIIFAFFGYFIMASIVFILFLDIFEPISIFILIKIINWWKNKKENVKKVDYKPFLYGMVFAIIPIFGFLGLAYLISLGLLPIVNFDYSLGLFNADPSLSQALQFDLAIIFNTILSPIIPLSISLISLFMLFKIGKKVTLSLFGFMTMVLLISILFQIITAFTGIPLPPLINLMPTEEYWITGRSSIISLFGIDFFTLRTASFTADLTGILWILAIPYIFSRNVFNIIFLGLFIYYITKNFRSKNIVLGEKLVKKVIYTDVDFITYNEYNEIRNQKEDNYIVTEGGNEIEKPREEIKQILEQLQTKDIPLQEIIPEDASEAKRVYITTKYLQDNDIIKIWQPELWYTFERVKKQGLYVIYEDGRGVYDYQFSEDALQDPGIISGMFSAISSFVKETTKSTEVLQTIEHGDITIVIEYGEKIFGALFIKGNQTSEIRAKLREFVDIFEDEYREPLKDWSGDLKPFKNAENLVDQVFTET